jgi:hypothetical protein
VGGGELQLLAQGGLGHCPGLRLLTGYEQTFICGTLHSGVRASAQFGATAPAPRASVASERAVFPKSADDHAAFSGPSLSRRGLGSDRWPKPYADMPSYVSFELHIWLARALPLHGAAGDETPPKSRAEMAALAELPQVQVRRLAKGKLSIHEELPETVTSIIMPFVSA